MTTLPSASDDAIGILAAIVWDQAVAELAEQEQTPQEERQSDHEQPEQQTQ